MSFFGQRNYNLEVARGSISGQQAIYIISVNPAVGQSIEDIWDIGGNLTYPTVNETWAIRSTSIDDTIDGGAGATVVAMEYMDETYNVKFVTTNLSGTTPISFVTDGYRFRRMLVTEAGASGASLGNITLHEVSNSGQAGIRGQINIGNNNTNNSHFTVPSGKTAFLEFLFTNINKNEDIDISLVATIGSGTVFSDRYYLSLYQNSADVPITFPSPFTEFSDIKATASSSDIDATATVIMQFNLIDNLGSPILDAIQDLGFG